MTAISWAVLLLLLFINLKTNGLVNFYFGAFLYYIFGLWPIVLLIHRNRITLANNLKEITNFISRKLEEESSPKDRKIIFYALLAIVGTGLILRVLAIKDMGFSADSFLHTESARSILDGLGNFYHRGELYTYLIAGSYSLFGVSELTTHIPNLLLALSTLLFSYYSVKKIFSEDIGALTAAILALSFWHIGETANIRMYMFFTLASFISFYTICRFFFVPKNFTTDAKPIETTVLLKWPYLIIIIFWLLVSLNLQMLIGVFLLPILAFFIFLAGYLGWTDFKKNRTSVRTDNAVKIILLIVLVSFIGLIFFPELLGQFWSGLKWNAGAWQNFRHLSENVRNGYGWMLGLYGEWVFYGALTLFFIFTAIKKNISYLFWQFSFVVIWLEMLFLIDRYFSPRYMIFLLPIFAPILGGSIYWLVSLLTPKRLWRGAISLALILIITPWPQINSVIKDKIGENSILGINYAFKGAVNSLPIQPTDALVQTFFGPFEFYQHTSENIFNIARISSDGDGTEISVRESEQKFFSVIKKYRHGYFLTDFYRFEKWPCEKYVPCSIYDYIESNPDKFTRLPYSKDPQLILYEWQSDSNIEIGKSPQS